MKTQINMVQEFHESFGQENGIKPKVLKTHEFMLRYKLMTEENKEYLEACIQGDLTGIADALGDELYILLGTILKHGLQDIIEQIFTEIHRSNMSKLDANGKPIFREDGKILKSDRYFMPEIGPIIVSSLSSSD